MIKKCFEIEIACVEDTDDVIGGDRTILIDEIFHYSGNSLLGGQRFVLLDDAERFVVEIAGGRLTVK